MNNEQGPLFTYVKMSIIKHNVKSCAPAPICYFD